MFVVAGDLVEHRFGDGREGFRQFGQWHDRFHLQYAFGADALMTAGGEEREKELAGEARAR